MKELMTLRTLRDLSISKHERTFESQRPHSLLSYTDASIVTVRLELPVIGNFNHESLVLTKTSLQGLPTDRLPNSKTLQY